MSQKPDDFRTVSLCRECHAKQHRVGERTFWKGRDVEALIAEFCKASPRAAQIREAQREREHA
jgi:indole-3-glycerol phosphate synthase